MAITKVPYNKEIWVYGDEVLVTVISALGSEQGCFACPKSVLPILAAQNADRGFPFYWAWTVNGKLTSPVKWPQEPPRSSPLS